MIRYAAGHVLQYGLVLAVVLTINFALPRVAPGTPVDYLVGDQAVHLTAAQKQDLLAQFDLDAPVADQFKAYVSGLFRGDLGLSVRFGKPVTDVLLDYAPYTLLLVGLSIVLSSALGTVLGVLAAFKRGRAADVGTLSVVTFLDSTPIFWLGMVLLGVFAAQLGWFPIFGSGGVGGLRGGGLARHLVLPVATLTLGTVGSMFLVARYAMVSTLREDYMLVGEAAGLSERRLVFGHALRNSLLPVSTVTMLHVAFLFGGAVVVETVFSYPGLGRLIYDSVLARDYPLLQGAFLLLGVGVILANLTADLLYPLLDPRIRRPARAA